MNVSSPLFVLAILLITFLTGYLINIKHQSTTRTKRYETIDGLRGFLAICVFIHHSNIWHKYLHTGEWVAPDSNLLNQLGQTGVALFFMISSFLFVKMLIEYNKDNYDWKFFFIKRLFRLTPLHFFTVTIIIIIVLIQSDWTLKTSLVLFSKNTLEWYGFGILGLSDINDVDTAIINAGVLWSLPYEWLLYFTLPLISLIILKSKPKLFYILLSLSFIITTLLFRSFDTQHILSFVGGAIAPIILKYNRKKINWNNPWITLIVFLSTILIFQFHSSSNFICKLLITCSFTLIALGNNFIGLLKNSTLKLLGEISYSTYLLHGLILFVVINYVHGLEKTKLLSETQFCLFIFAVSPLVIIISFLTYRFIERPFITKAKRLTTTLKN